MPDDPQDPVAAAKAAVAKATARAAVEQLESGLGHLLDEALTNLEEAVLGGAAEQAEAKRRAEADPLDVIRARYGIDAPGPVPPKEGADADLRAQLAELKRKMGK